MRQISLLLLLSFFVSPGFAQRLGSSEAFSSSAISFPLSDGGAVAAPSAGGGTVMPVAAGRSGPFSALAVGVNVGLLGVGFEAATPLSNHLNLRAGGNFFNFSDTFSTDGVNYNANLRFRSADASVDWFPWANGFHVSPGALLYNGNQVTARTAVPADNTFTLNNTTYLSSPSDPVSGNGSLTFSKAAPKITIGFGNMIPRSGRHFSVPFDVGFAYVGDPQVKVALNGTACYDYQGSYYCSDVATDPLIQANLAAQVKKMNKDVSPVRFYPLISTGFSYRF